MSRLYRIKPLEKKNVEAFYDVYENLPDGSIRGFTITETYRWGQGFRELDDQVYRHELNRVRCNTHVGWGAELDDLCAVSVEWDGEFSHSEMEDIEARFRGNLEDEEGRWGAAWLFDGDHNWQVEDDCIYVYGPISIDIVDEDVYNSVIEENVAPNEFEPSTLWPFPPVESNNK